jgi:hypothetical protein
MLENFLRQEVFAIERVKEELNAFGFMARGEVVNQWLWNMKRRELVAHF